MYLVILIILSLAVGLVVSSWLLARWFLRGGQSRLRLLWSAHLVASSAFGALSVLFGATYELWLPHPLGHIAPAFAIAAMALWFVLGTLLCRAFLDGSWRHCLRNNLISLFCFAAGSGAWWMRYEQQRSLGFGGVTCGDACLTIRSSGQINRFAIDAAA